MSMLRIPLLTIIFPVMMIASCRKNDVPTQEVSCLVANSSLYFVGFDSGEIRGVRVVPFEKGSSFAQPKDSTTIELTRTAVSYNTLYPGDTTATGIAIHPDYDYIIRVLPSGQSWTLTGISHQKLTRNVAADVQFTFFCPFASYTVNGEKRVFPPKPEGGNAPFVFFK